MNNILIAIPSKSRPVYSKSKELLKSAILFIPENEEKYYSKIYDKNELILVPSDIKGITKTRNWILKNVNYKYVVFIDDDLKQTGYWMDKEGGKRKFIKIQNENIIINEFKKLFQLCDDMNYKLFSVKSENSKISQHDEKPILFQSYLTASCMGIVNDGEYYFDENFELKEDYEIGLRHIKNKGGIIAARYFSWENHHWEREGGCGDYRNDELEKKCINQLIKLYPEYVRKVERKNSQYCIKLQF